MRRLLPLVLIAITGLATCGSSNPVESNDTTLPTVPTVPPTDSGEPAGPDDPPPTSPVPPETGDTGPGTSVAEPGLDQSALVGPIWIVERFITVGPLDLVPDGVVARIEFGGLGAIFVETGCNSGSGQVRFNPDGTFTVIQLGLTEIACDGDAGAVETRMIAQLQLGKPLNWSVDGDQLTIFPVDVSDTGIVLRAS